MKAALILLALLCFVGMSVSVDRITKDWGRTLFNISATVFMLVVFLLIVGCTGKMP